ncbi:hypothetical protein [Rheinheimera soli]|uniref:Uncharacterized protein n=1 Tax=Rheinheimera soli TaxID=443616 RepID=A0ABU1W5Y9_9GAMM|nr:hypothetical protein [Rheinheimera soli]MDR7123158.1 hypothetical protein [Rheinheimera soli]
MYKKIIVSFCSLLVLTPTLQADPDSDYKAYPQERFAIATGDGNYKQAYHWTFNPNGSGPAVVVFLNHGSGGEWYKNISSLGPCGKDYVSSNGDFTGTNYEGLCTTDNSGQRQYLANYLTHHVPVGPALDKMMKRSIVGSSAFAAWYWQDAFKQFNSPVHIFMVGRYNIAKKPEHLDNALFWLNITDPNTVDRDTLPPYNFDGDGLSAIDNDKRPFHTAPDLSAFDTMFLYKAVRERWPTLDLSNLVIEGRSNGGSAMIALVADPAIWPSHIKDYWSRNLAALPPIEIPEHNEPRQALTVQNIAADPILSAAFDQMLEYTSREDVMEALNAGKSLQLFADSSAVASTAGQVVSVPTSPGGGSGAAQPFDLVGFRDQLNALIHGDIYQSVKLTHMLYPGCRLDGFMEKDQRLPTGTISDDGASKEGYKVSMKTLFSFAAEDNLYTTWCDDRVEQALAQTSIAGNLTTSDFISAEGPVHGQVFSPARHGFEYKDVNKNLSKFSSTERARAAQARLAIERVLNTAMKEMGLTGQYQLPENLN